MEVAGEQAISEVPRSKRQGLLAKRSPPATHRPSQGQFHGTIDQGRDSNPLSMVRSIRNLHHQRIYSGIAGTTMTALSVIASEAKQAISLRDYTPTKFQDPSCSNCLEDLRRERTRRGQIGEWPAAEPWIASLRSQ
jgi:hypothetical protein